MGRKKKQKQERRAAAAGLRRVVTFDEENRRDYLTGFHKRKVERRKAAVEEIKRKLKDEQKKMKEERHKEYMKMLKEREEALEEADELEQMVTSQTQSVSYDHPNHTVTVTTISDLDLSGARLVGLSTNEGEDAGVEKKDEDASSKPACIFPKKSRDPFLSQSQPRNEAECWRRNGEIRLSSAIPLTSPAWNSWSPVATPVLCC